MGNYLSYPSLKKHTDHGKNARFLYAVSEMQGWRLDMEDAHATVPDLDEDSNLSNGFFAVYDGHGGVNTAKYSGPNVHLKLVTEPAYKSKSYAEALKRTFLDVDEDLKALQGEAAAGPSGCTAVAALVTHDNRVFVANAGDSRAVISCGGTCKALSTDHKPGDAAELKRITDAHGFVRFGRVNGNLALSRAFGDFEYKKNEELSPEAQIITCDPEITEHAISHDDEFLIIACDGIWDCVSSQTAVDSVRFLLSQGFNLSEVCDKLLDHLIAPDTDADSPAGCDNMTVLIVALLNGKTEEEWYKWIQERAKQNSNVTGLPVLYDNHRLTRFEKRKRMMEERDRQREQAAVEATAAVGSGATTPTQTAPEPTPGASPTFLATQQQLELTSPASA